MTRKELFERDREKEEYKQKSITEWLESISDQYETDEYIEKTLPLLSPECKQVYNCYALGIDDKNISTLTGIKKSKLFAIIDALGDAMLLLPRRLDDDETGDEFTFVTYAIVDQFSAINVKLNYGYNNFEFNARYRANLGTPKNTQEGDK